MVGAGTSGCALAARLADAGRRVLLLEAGADHAQPADFPPELRDAATHAAPPCPGTRRTGTSRRADRRADRAGAARPGRRRVERAQRRARSSAATPADLDGWAADGNDLWSYDAVLPAFRRLEADREFGDRPEHGADGPGAGAPAREGHPLADAFAAAAGELGHPAEPDKNAGGPRRATGRCR